MASEAGSSELDHPDPPEPTFPPAPEVQGVEVTGASFDCPRKIQVTVDYHTHRNGNVDPYSTTVHFRVVDNVTAELRDVDGSGRLIDQISAIITACERVENHPLIESVNGLDELSEQAMRYIDKCEEHEEK